ncbi:hypothetical protein N8987_01365 [Crocinitomix sp.]|nr:hypothetical protein [Crocinitomix sp.]
MTSKKINDSAFKTMTTLSLIANTVWGTLFLLLLVACVFNSEAVLNSTKDSISPNELFGNLIVLFLILSAIVVILCWFCIRGISRMKKGELRGFYTYALTNGLWALLQIYIGSDGTIPYLISGVVSIIFIFYFALKLPKFS